MFGKRAPKNSAPAIAPHVAAALNSAVNRPVLDVSAYGREAARVDAMQRLSREFNAG